jgi:hypothetical protein
MSLLPYGGRPGSSGTQTNGPAGVGIRQWQKCPLLWAPVACAPSRKLTAESENPSGLGYASVVEHVPCMDKAEKNGGR